MRLLALERFGKDTLARQPEPSPVMSAPETVEAFDVQGAAEGPLIPLYHFIALGLSRLVPRGGRLLDLGSGSGRLLAYLAAGRPDIEVIGLELSRPMIDVGNRTFRDLGLFPRVRLEYGDMTEFVYRDLPRIDGISVNLALEHLDDLRAVRRLLREVRTLVQKFDAAFWLFNHSRPRTRAVADLFPEVFTPEAPQPFREDSRNSLIASWRYEELAPIFHDALGDTLRGRCSRLLPLYLAFWRDAERHRPEALWQSAARPAGSAGRQFAACRAVFFPDVPLDRPL
jgi:SAM-dependent methyltransferase